MASVHNIFMVLDPALSVDGNVGIEVSGDFIGAYTACCNSDPVWDGTWKCGMCAEGLHTQARGGIETCLDLTAHSAGDVSYFVNAWMSRDDVEVQILLP